MTDAEAAMVLRQARQLIEKPESWTQRAAAKGADGSHTVPSDELAVCWCAWGAIRKIEGERDESLVTPPIAALSIAAGWEGSGSQLRMVWEFNDSKTHAEVLAAFDNAIEIVEGT